MSENPQEQNQILEVEKGAQSLVGFFDLLLLIDQRVNASEYYDRHSDTGN